MPLSPEQQQELAELRRLDQLEAKFGGAAPKAPAKGLLDRAMDAYGGFTNSGVQPLPQDPKDREGYMQANKQAAGLAGGLAASALAPAKPLAQGMVGAAQGVATAPEGGRTWGGIKGFLLGSTAGMIPAAFKAAQPSRNIGGTLAGLTDLEKEGYVPRLSEEMATQRVQNPEGFNAAAEDKLRSAKQSLWEQSQPARDNLRQLGIGKEVNVPLKDFKGTAVEPYLQDVHSSQTPPVETPYETIPAQYPTDPQATLNMSYKKAEEARRIAQQAAQPGFNQQGQYIPQGRPEDVAARDSLQRILETRAPESAGLRSEMGAAAHDSDRIDHLLNNNPMRIYNSSESLGSGPVSTLQQALDRKTGSSFVPDAQALDAGQALRRGSTKTLTEWTKPIGKKMLRYGIPAEDAVSSAAPPTGVLLNSIFSGNGDGQNTR